MSVEYKMCCHLLVPRCICHWEAHSSVLSKWSMKNGHTLCLKQNKLVAFICKSERKLLWFVDCLLPLECV